MKVQACTTRRPGPRWRAAFAVLATCTVSMLVSVVTATPAQARCNGVGNPVTMVLRNNAGLAIARERPISGVCDNNNVYGGDLQDSLTDGSCAFLDIYDYNGGERYNLGVVECVTGDWERFGYFERDGFSWLVLRTNYAAVTRNSYGF